MLGPNPYNYRSPANRDMLFGRENDIVQITHELLSPSSPVVALIGGPQIGKTSLLNGVLNHLSIAAEDSSRKIFPLPIVIHFESNYEFKDPNKWIETINRQLFINLHRQIEAKYSPTFILNQSATNLFQFEDMTSQWRNTVHNLRGRDLQLVLFFDNVDKIIQFDWSNDFFQWATSLKINPNISPLLNIFLTGARAFYEKAKQNDFPLQKLLSFHTIGILDQESALNLINRPSHYLFPPSIVQEIIYQSGRHPYLLQFILHSLWNYELDQISTQAIKDITDDFSRKNNNFSVWLDELGNPGFAAYQAITKKSQSSKDNKTIPSRQDFSLQNPLEMLCAYGLATYTELGYQPTGAMFRSWFQLHADEIRRSKKEFQIQGNKQEINLLQIQLTSDHKNTIVARGIHVPKGGNPKHTSHLPYPIEHLPILLKLLELGDSQILKFSPQEILILESIGLAKDNTIDVDYLTQIGQNLFNTLFGGDLRIELELAKQSKSPIFCELCFDDDEVELVQYPWELIHDGNHFLVPTRNSFDLTRSIWFSEHPQELWVDTPLRMLLIRPRPLGNNISLDHREGNLIKQALEKLCQTGKLTITELQPPTWDELEKTLADEVFEIVHFDGHGSFARICPVCGKAHFPKTKICVNCKHSLDRSPKGFLEFEDENHYVNRVVIGEIKNLFYNSETRLFVLSTCLSGAVSDTTVFNGVGPGLIGAGIPSVLAMQGSPPIESTVRFMQRFYTKLSEGVPIPRAVNMARLAIFKVKPTAWFMPVIYLRSSDKNSGKLFNP